MNICRKCKHRTYYRTGIDGIVVIDCCRNSVRGEDSVNPVTGEMRDGKYVECNKINIDGRCVDFEEKPWWKFW